jgi:hypothetical protein
MPTFAPDDIDFPAAADYVRAVLNAIPAADDSPRNRPTRHRLQGVLIALSYISGVDPLTGLPSPREATTPPPVIATAIDPTLPIGAT